MFQFRRFPAYAYFIQRTLHGLFPCGFPHSDICGSMLICSSPQLFAAYHVLLRLPVPRHSPCALFHLTFSSLTGVAPGPVELYETLLQVFTKFWQNCILPFSLCFTFSILSSLSIIQFSRCVPSSRDALPFPSSLPCLQSRKKSGGLRWTRTIDLTLIRRAL